MPVPLWFVICIFATAFIVGKLVIKASFRNFVPALQKASMVVIKNNQRTLDAYFEKVDQQIVELNSSFEEVTTRSQNNFTKGDENVKNLHQDVANTTAVLQTSIETLQKRFETIVALEAEIIKLKNILKRK